MEINQDFKELLKLLTEKDVKFLVVGGYAVNYHGYPRFTEDLDLLVLVSPENAKKICQVLVDFGFGGLGIKDTDFLKPNMIIQLGQAPYRIDIMTSADGVEFNKMYPHKVIYKQHDLEIPIIGLQDLINNKLSTARSQDIADAEYLQSINEEQE